MEKKHILLVDDNDIENMISRRVITDSGVAEKVTTRHSAAKALDYLRDLNDNLKEFPDIVFLDIRMPEMDGFDMLDYFPEFPQYLVEKCDVFILTSSENENDMERAKTIPYIKRYLNKPLDKEMLMGILTKD